MNTIKIINDKVQIKKTVIISSIALSLFLLLSEQSMAAPKPLICATDDFTQPSTLNTDWIIAPGGVGMTPFVDTADNTLQLTPNAHFNTSLVVYKKYRLSTAGGYAEVSFDRLAFGGAAAGSPERPGDGIALILADASLPMTHTGGTGGALGYSAYIDSGTNLAGFSGGWLGIGFDEYGAYGTSLVPGDGGATPWYNHQINTMTIRGQGIIDSSNDYRAGYKILATHAFSTLSTDGLPNLRDNIKVIADAEQRSPGAAANPACANGKLCITVQRSLDGGATYNDIVTAFPINQTLPDVFSFAISASNGSSFNFHKVDNFKICSENPLIPEQYLDHFEFTYPENTTSCMDKAVTIKACADNASPCTPMTTETSIDLAPITGATWLTYNNCVSGDNSCTNVESLVNNKVTFLHGIATVALRNNDNQANNVHNPVTISWLSSQPSYPPLITTYDHDLCNGAIAPTTPGAHCLAYFNTSGLIVEGITPDGIAGKPVDITFSAVKDDPSNTTDHNRCIPRFTNDVRTIKFSGEHASVSSANTLFNINPLTSAVSSGVPTGAPYYLYGTDNGNQITNWDNTHPTAGTDVDVYFDSTGDAKIKLSYLDAGQIKLHMAYIGTVAENEVSDGTPLTLLGTSDIMTIRPYGLCVTPVIATTPATCKYGMLTGVASCNPYAYAGDNVALSVIGKQWDAQLDNATTYPVTVDGGPLDWLHALSFNQLMCGRPSNLDTPSLILSDITYTPQYRDALVNAPIQTGAHNSAIGTNKIAVQFNDVGIFDVALGSLSGSASSYTVNSMSYMSKANVTIPGALLTTIGTIIPKYFEMTTTPADPMIPDSELPLVKNFYPTFSYMNTPMRIKYKLAAKSATGITTANYDLSHFPIDYLTPFNLDIKDLDQGAILTNRIVFSPNATIGGVWTNGLFSFDNNTIEFIRNTSTPASTPIKYVPDGPYLHAVPILTNASSCQWTSGTPCPVIPFKYLNSAGTAITNNSMAINPTPATPTPNLDIRFGYLKVNPKHSNNIYIGNDNDLTIDFEAQYWDSTQNKFIINTADNNTYLYPVGEVAQQIAQKQCRDGSISGVPSLNNYLMVPDFTQNQNGKIQNGRGLLTIHSPAKNEAAVIYWFLMGNTNDPINECTSLENGAPTLSQSWLQFDARKNNQAISPSAIVSFKHKLPVHSVNKKIIYKNIK